jgi:hypothetical protein
VDIPDLNLLMLRRATAVVVALVGMSAGAIAAQDAIDRALPWELR